MGSSQIREEIQRGWPKLHMEVTEHKLTKMNEGRRLMISPYFAVAPGECDYLQILSVHENLN